MNRGALAFCVFVGVVLETLTALMLYVIVRLAEVMMTEQGSSTTEAAWWAFKLKYLLCALPLLLAGSCAFALVRRYTGERLIWIAFLNMTLVVTVSVVLIGIVLAQLLVFHMCL